MKKILGLICIMVFAIALTACSGSDPNDDLVGTWRLQDDASLELVFNGDGTGEVDFVGIFSVNFEWEISEAGTVMIELEDGERLAASVDDDVLLVGVLNIETPSGPVFWGEPDIFYRVD